MNKTLSLLVLVVVIIASCKKEAKISSINPVNWQKREVKGNLPDSLIRGSSYLSIYSQIYSESETRVHDLAATVSIRNTSRTDTIYLDRADYYNTAGSMIRSYFNHSIFVTPMETVEIIIDQVDQEGGHWSQFHV